MTNYLPMCLLYLFYTYITSNSATNPGQTKRFLANGPCISKPPSVQYGTYVCDSSRPTCTLKCDPGYKPSARQTIHCSPFGAWSQHGTCNHTCITPSNPTHGRYSCPSSTHHPGSHCTLSCDHGYQIDSTSSSVAVTCETNGTWSSQPQCRDLSCHNLPTVANGVYVCSSSNHVTGSTCQLYCSKGHRLVGIDVISCGGNQQWSSPAACEDVTCPKPPELQDGSYICPPSPYTHGTTCQLQCAAGHRPVTDITNITCRADETWSPATTCTEGCSHGSFVKLSPTGEHSCEPCTVGTYQSKADSPSCEPCPGGWTTFSTGSVSVDSCLSICHPGTYSNNGLEPCHLCHLGSYKNATGGQDCDPCPVGQTTEQIGSTGVNDCVDI